MAISKSSLDANFGTKESNSPRQPCLFRRLGDKVNILICAGSFFRYAPHGSGPYQYALSRQFIDQRTAFPPCQRLMPAHGAAGAMTGRGKRRVSAGAGQDVRARSHAAADDDRLTHGSITLRQHLVPRAECACGAFAVHVKEI